METNFEVKVKIEDLGAFRGACQRLGFEFVRTDLQSDTYMRTTAGRLKLRRTVLSGDELISYKRPDVRTSKVSDYWKIDLGSDGSRYLCALASTLGVWAHVVKKRTLFLWQGARIHLDFVFDLGEFVEIEVPIMVKPGSNERALLRDVFGKLDLGQGSIVAVSYADLLRRKRIVKQKERGRLLVVDGPSSSGKSTVVREVLQKHKELVSYVRRYTTRPERGGMDDWDYVRVAPSQFQQFVRRNQLLEYKNFLFGMSYGLSLKHAQQVLRSGKVALGIINLGNIIEVRRRFPGSVAVFIDADYETLDRRLRARGKHSEAQIAERLQNASRYADLKKEYDFVLLNNDGRLEYVVALMSRIVHCLAPPQVLLGRC